jgi:hypothetical protein
LRTTLIIATSGILLATVHARPVEVDVDITWPSVGPGSAGLRPLSRIVTVDQSTIPPDTAGAELLLSAPPDQPPDSKTPTAVLQFDGVAQSPSIDGGFLYKPPDTHLAVGPGAGAAGRVVAVTNTGVQIFNKSGTSVAGPTDLDAFLGLGSIGTANSAFDPKVLYDQHSGRFFIVILAGRTPNPAGTNNVWICVSSSSTPGNLTTDWAKLSGSALTLIGAFNTWFDYPSIGADSGSLFVTGNLFDSGGTNRGTKIRVFNKASLLAGSYAFTDLDYDASVTLGIGTIQPAHVFGSTDNGNFYLVNRYGSTAYRLWEISGAPSSPAVVSNATYSWTAGASLTGAPQSGVTGITIDTLSPRIMNAVYRSGHVWCTLTSDMDSDSQTEVAWFRIATNGGFPTSPTIPSTGYIDGSAASKWVFMPAIAVSALGNAMICYSQSASDQFVDMRVVAHHNTETSPFFQGPQTVKTSAGEYDDFNANNPERWGDYAAAVVDPDDSETFWVANEYCKTARSAGDDARWGTWIAKMGAVVPVPVQLSGFSVD